jgi:hypothetical protein
MNEVDRLKFRQATLDVVRFLKNDLEDDVTSVEYMRSFNMLFDSFTEKQIKTGKLV